MATISPAQPLTLYYCNGSQADPRSGPDGAEMISNAFNGKSVFIHEISLFTLSHLKEKRLEQQAQSVTSLVEKIMEDYKVFQMRERNECRYRLILFAFGEGSEIVEMAIKKLPNLKTDITVYCFAPTKMIQNQLAGKVCHFAFANHVKSENTILSRMNDILSKASEDKPFEIALNEQASIDQAQTTPLSAVSLDGDNVFGEPFERLKSVYQGYFQRYTVEILPGNPEVESGKNLFSAYKSKVQEIARLEMNLHDDKGQGEPSF